MADDLGNKSVDQLRQLIERVERLNEEKQGILDDIKDVFSEAKANGFDTRTMRRVIAERKLEKHIRQERQMLLDTYKSALGLLD